MNYDESVKVIDFLNKRLRKIQPIYKWGIDINWNKILKLFNFLTR
jgi:hypothetical protein